MAKPKATPIDNSARAEANRRADAWGNVLTGLATARDKRQASAVLLRRIDEYTAEELYRSGAQAGRVVDIPPVMQLGNGFGVKVQTLAPSTDQKSVAEVIDAFPVSPKKPKGQAYVPGADQESPEHEAAEALGAQLDELDATARFIEARCWERTYGGSALLMGCEDGQADLSKPVRTATLKAVRYLVPLKPRECRPVKWENNPLKGGYGQPLVYQVQRDSSGGSQSARPFEVHCSRILRFGGVRASRRHLAENHGWGDSIFVRLVDSLRDYETSYDTVPVLLQDFAQAVWKIKGLAGLLAGDEDELILARIKVADEMRSIIKALVTDAEDTFERMQTPVTGLDGMLEAMAKKWAADTGIPPALLFGEAPAGLNATGASNLQFFFKEMISKRKLEVEPRCKQLVRLMFQALEGPTQGKEPGRWCIEFGPIYEPTPAELADLRGKVATADAAYVGAGVLLPEEVAVSRFGGAGGWSIETTLDMDARKIQAEADQLAAENPEVDPNNPDDPALQPEGKKPPPGAKQPAKKKPTAKE